MPQPKYHHGHRVRPPDVPSQQDPDDDDPDLARIPISQPEPPQLPPPTTLERPPECINRFSTPAFSLLCSVMDRMRSEDSGKKRFTLSRFISLWRIKVGNDLYPLIRLLLPDRDRERPVYNLKEAMLAKCYIEVLGLDKHSDAAQRLIKWKQPVEGSGDDHSGDFARVCFHEISSRSTVEEGSLTIDGVNSLLDELAKGRLKQSDYVPILRKVNRQCTPVEQEWIIRIILKDLRISLREKGVFGCLHPDAGDLFNVCSDLKRVCWTLYKPSVRLEKNQTHIELFRSFLPQLCYRSPTSSHDAVAKLVGAPKEFIMEEKLDGERIQLHMRNSGAEWFYCSRKSKDYTYLYGSHPGEGSLTQFIAGAFRKGVRNVILDGEMLVWDPILEKYLAFGTLKTAAKDKIADENGARPCFKIFDILYLNDRCLTGIRLSERKRLLKSGSVFENLEDYQGRLEFAQEARGNSGKDILGMLEKILESRGEGLVVKNIDSVYETNSRGADWVKVKPEYSDQMGENLELLVLGGWWGKGGRTGKISSLLCGLRVQHDDDGSGEVPKFATFASVGSGMSYEDYEWILNKHKEHWKPFDRNNPPSWLELGVTGMDDKPDVYINPRNSFVIEVKASEIVRAVGNYGAGYTLRFPRCRYIYWDRGSRDHAPSEDRQERDMWSSLSLEEFLQLLHRPSRRYADDPNGTRRVKKRKGPGKRKVEILNSTRGQKLDGQLAEDTIFKAMTFYIPKDSPGHTKAELEALVHKHGGDFTQAQLSDGSAVVISSDDKTPRVKAQIRQGNSVVKPEWIFASIERQRPLPLLQIFLVYASEAAKADPDYEKTLEEYDVRTGDRNFGADSEEEEGMEEEEEEEENEEERPAKKAKQGGDMSPRPKSEAQLKAEKEWGVAGIREPPSQDSSSRWEEDDPDTGDESQRSDQDGVDDEEEEEGEDSHDSTPEVDTRLLPVHGVDKQPEGYQPMGEDSSAMAYDEDKIFYHLVFYIDTAENAERNSLQPSEPSKATTQRLSQTETMLRENGGRIVDDPDDPKITHIVIDDDDSGRYAELSRRTAKPKRKHIVLPSWVEECVEEETLVNEDAHRPR